MNKIIPYKPYLKSFARELRKNMTLAERELWEKIRKKSLGVEFHRQVPILDYIVDFYCHEIGLVIELDGKIHEYKIIEDGIRQGNLESRGLTIIRFKNKEVFDNIDKVLVAIAHAIKELS